MTDPAPRTLAVRRSRPQALLSVSALLVAVFTASPLQAQSQRSIERVRLLLPGAAELSARQVELAGLLRTATVSVGASQTIPDLLRSQNIRSDRDALALFFDLNPGIRNDRDLRVGQEVLLPALDKDAEAVAALGSQAVGVRFGWREKLTIDGLVGRVQDDLGQILGSPELAGAKPILDALDARLADFAVGGAAATSNWLDQTQENLDLAARTVDALRTVESPAERAGLELDLSEAVSNLEDLQEALALGAPPTKVEAWFFARLPDGGIASSADIDLVYASRRVAEECARRDFRDCRRINTLGRFQKADTVLFHGAGFYSYGRYRIWAVNRTNRQLSCLTPLDQPQGVSLRRPVSIVLPPDEPRCRGE